MRGYDPPEVVTGCWVVVVGAELPDDVEPLLDVDAVDLLVEVVDVELEVVECVLDLGCVLDLACVVGGVPLVDALA